MARTRKLEKLENLNSQLSNVYYDLENPSSFGSLKGLQSTFKNVINKPDVKDWLLEQDSYNLHVANRRNYKTNHYLVFGPNELFELDLVDLKSISRFNYGYKYILCVIDCFTKFLWAVPLTSKSAMKTTDAFKSIVEADLLRNKPVAVNMDKGSEFNNAIFKGYAKKMGIQVNFPYIQSYQKASIVERVIRSLKERIFKYFTYRGPTYRKYIDVLPAFVKAYNNKVHSTTKIAPSEFKISDTTKVYNNIRRKVTCNDRYVQAKLKINDMVRIVRKKSILEHGYTQRWSKEIFRIHKVIYKKPIPLYTLTDLNNTPISGKFYETQLLRVRIPADSIIRIINSRQTRSRVQYEVETGDGSRMWISKEDYEKAKK